jgi:endoglucanase
MLIPVRTLPVALLCSVLPLSTAAQTPPQTAPGSPARAPAAAPARLAAPSLARIRVEGNHFVDADGNVIVVRGVSFSDPDRLEKAGQWSRRYFEAAKSWNANVVRFPVHPGAWRERGQDEYLRLLDQGVAWAGELGMYVIIDWHSIGNLRTELFTRPSYNTTRAETYRFWRAIAERYAGNPVVAFYELFNEPTIDNGRLGWMSWDEHKEIMEELISIIHAHDRNAIALVAGYNWAYDLTPVRESPIRAPNVAYVTHPYPQKRTPPWEDKWELDWGFVADRYPIVATELGFMQAEDRGAHVPVLGDEVYGRALIDYFNRKGISWTAWVFDPDWAPQLLQNWNFEPTRQGRFFRDELQRVNPPASRR